MPMTPPPLPLPPDEVKRRIKAGARTLAEIDPDLARWAAGNQRFRYLTFVVFVVGTIALATMLSSLLIRQCHPPLPEGTIPISEGIYMLPETSVLHDS